MRIGQCDFGVKVLLRHILFHDIGASLEEVLLRIDSAFMRCLKLFTVTCVLGHGYDHVVHLLLERGKFLSLSAKCLIKSFDCAFQPVWASVRASSRFGLAVVTSVSISGAITRRRGVLWVEPRSAAMANF